MRALLLAPDDGPADRVSRCECLTEVHLDRYADPNAARKLFDSEQHPLVVVEIAATGGLDLCRAIRRDRPRQRHVIVGLVRAADDELRHDALAAGCDLIVHHESSDELFEARIAVATERARRCRLDEGLQGAQIAIKRAMDRMQLGVTITSLDGTILYTNEADARMHGYEPEELVGHNVRVLSPPDAWRPVSVHDARGMSSWRRTSSNLRKDGTRFPVQLLSDVVHDTDGEPVAIVTVCEDLSDQRGGAADGGASHEELSIRVRERTTELLEANVRLQHEILERRRAERQLLYDSLHDSLTGLPNRALFNDRLARVIAGSGRHPDNLFAVMHLNLDRYRVIVEGLGPDAGDRLLVQAGERLANSVRPEDTIGRLGGDEFLVLLEDLRDASDATRVAQRIQSSIAQPMDIAGQAVFTTASIGIALSSTGYDKPEDMVRDAQVAMYRAKGESGGGQVIFDREMHRRAVARMKLEMDLRQAIEREDFTVYYQPIVDLTSGHIEGLEALARWERTDGETTPPNVFIALAEETGTIYELEHQILRQVCADITAWRDAVPTPVPYVSVNLSGKELANPRFPTRVRETMDGFGIAPGWLRFEVTEGSIVSNAEVAAQVLNELRDIGVRVYIDDFGTGYSSLSALHEFPIDTLKIDQSFVSGHDGRPGSWEIVRVIIGLAQSLGLDVIAEGIETADQLDAIRDLGCTYGQGFYLARPVRPSEVLRFLLSQRIDIVA